MYWNYYNEYSLDTKNIIRNNDYISILINELANMFDITGITPEQKYHLFREMIFKGSAYLKHTDDDTNIIIGGAYYGVPEKTDVFPKNYLATKFDFHFDGIPNYEDETIVYMIPERLPLDIVFRFASQLAEIDTSLVNNIQFSRIAPIPVVNDDDSKLSITEAIKGMIQGKLINTIKAKFVRINGNDELFPVINLSNGEYSEKIQYLSMYHEQVVSQFCRMFGINYNFISKQSNITNQELNNCRDYSRVYPLVLKECLNEGLNKIGLTAEFTKMYKWIEESDEMIEDSNSETFEEPEEPENKE